MLRNATQEAAGDDGPTSAHTQPKTLRFIAVRGRPAKHTERAKRTGPPSRSARGPPAGKSAPFQCVIRVLPGTPPPALDKTPVGEPLQATPSSKNPKYALKWRSFFWRRVEAGLSIPSNCNKSKSFLSDGWEQAHFTWQEVTSKQREHRTHSGRLCACTGAPPRNCLSTG